MPGNQESAPMLVNDVADEKSDCRVHFRNYDYFRYKRITPMGSRKHVVGAMRIMSRWPDHWSPSLSYWWLVVGVLCLLLLALYNNVLVMSMLPAHVRQQSKNALCQAEVPTPVYMHTIVNFQNYNVNKFIPYIEDFINNFPGLKYHLIVLINDTNDSERYVPFKNDKRNAIVENERKEIGDLNIEYVILSKYLDTSPLAKHWRQLPNHFIPFFARAISIWDKGGIAFDPNIILPGLYKFKYINKLRHIMLKYGKVSENNYVKDKRVLKYRNTVNNIQDIINEFENEEDNDINTMQIVLNEEENKVYKTFARNNDLAKVQHKNDVKIINEKSVKFKKIFDGLNTKYAVIINPNETKSSTLIIDSENRNEDDFVNTNTIDIDISAPLDTDIKEELPKMYNTENINLSIDINGNILASNTPCHAFIGMLFSNTHYFTKISITDYIIRELTIFCKGVLSSCKGINVIF